MSADLVDTQVRINGTMSVEKAGTPIDRTRQGYHPSLQIENLVKNLEEAELDLQQRLHPPRGGSPKVVHDSKRTSPGSMGAGQVQRLAGVIPG